MFALSVVWCWLARTGFPLSPSFTILIPPLPPIPILQRIIGANTLCQSTIPAMLSVGPEYHKDNLDRLAAQATFFAGVRASISEGAEWEAAGAGQGRGQDTYPTEAGGVWAQRVSSEMSRVNLDAV